ncbi:beta-1:4-N-acetylgalactosaminyltransferase bre-4-like isoform X2 [Leptotrombidium deliense]|uniref:Beta-1:4-N-acetylgalactosaminyltransferase bre-4-like isoform X2 n=1 Tax=Leptotrombidium deliense TaxID=299467 RepID=A0A443SC48_9ACAR|nr:beta-1:4-N-acetylgalactosaminyltransferase bre-4-like isoform X2 [Leptotrombidium deliense]
MHNRRCCIAFMFQLGYCNWDTMASLTRIDSALPQRLNIEEDNHSHYKNCRKFNLGLKQTLFAIVSTSIFVIFIFGNVRFPQNVKIISREKCENNQNPMNQLMNGGHYISNVNKSKEIVAIIIPLRGRKMNLKIFLRYMHPFLMRQQIEYGIYVIEQSEDKREFNRAKLFNVGYVEALKEYNYSCFIFHDVDLLPENDDDPPYTCGPQPIHLSAAVDTLNYKLKYTGLIGGVTALTQHQMQRVNGYSNSYWGWGGEDDDLYNRLTSAGYSISRYPNNRCRFTMLKHNQTVAHETRFKVLNEWRRRKSSDGLNSLTYEVQKYDRKSDHTRITDLTVETATFSTKSPKLTVTRKTAEDNKFYAFHYIPKAKASKQILAVIVPVRDREAHLKVFIPKIQAFIKKQNIEFGLYVVEQIQDGKYFNKGRLMNVGFVEALKEYKYTCFIFHDVDLIPESSESPPYKCNRNPTHLSVAVDTLNYTLLYQQLVGGVFAISKRAMKKVNGYSNEYWGWGAEDDDMGKRILNKGYKIERYSKNICRYTMIKHKKAFINITRKINVLKKWKSRVNIDGLNSLKYKIERLEHRRDYTWLLVNIDVDNEQG